MKTELRVAPAATSVRNVGHTLATAALVVFTALPAFLASPAARAEVAQLPLVLTVPVNPNLILAIDDSGSMDAEVLMPANDGAMWWHTGNKSFATDGVINFNNGGSADGTWKKYIYLFPNGTGITNGRRGYDDSTNDHFAIPPLPAFAFTRSPEYNAAYFNPTESYLPWSDVGGYTFDDADPAAAKSDPVFGSETFNLTADRWERNQNEVFRMYAGMTLPAGTDVCIKNWAGDSCSWKNLSSDVALSGDRWVGIGYFPATFYLPVDAELPSEYATYTGNTTPSGHSPGASTPDLVRYEIKSTNFSSSADYNAAIQNFANWFTYYRKRHLATRGGIAGSFEDTSRLNAGSFRINPRENVTMQDLSDADGRDAFFQGVLTSIGTGGTPNREALDHAGRQFQRTDSGAPIAYACQQNFTALFTDGFANPSTGLAGNEDGGYGAPFADTASGTIADIAMSYYSSNLRPNLPSGEVPTQRGCDSANPDPSLDCNDNPHMVTFGIVLGNKGQIYLVDEDATEDPYSNPPAWPTSFPQRHPSAVDDLWHATINSRGEMLNARRPSEVSDQFAAVLNNIAGRTSSAAAVATNSTRLGTDTAVFQAAFESTRWSGDLQVFHIDEEDGSIDSTPTWNAADWLDLLSEANLSSRKIFTATPLAVTGEGSWLSTTGRDFVWAELATAQQDALRQQPGGGPLESSDVGQDRLDYLRGSRSDEQPQSGGTMRQRDSRLGDIVNSDPQFVHKQDFGYVLLDQSEAFSGLGAGAAYSSYRESIQGRLPMVVVGANDGMLHGFDASLDGDGEELFAFVPNAVFENLYELTLPEYSHRYFVDSTPRVADALLDGSWRTIVVGATGAGGKSVFALDVTDPATMSEDSVLWEFSHPSMGYTIGQPAVTPLPNGEFGVVVTSGYETGQDDGTIWILDPDDGSIIKSFTLPDSGELGAPLVADLNSDRVADRIYVGDTDGNLWRLDLEGSTTNQWGVPGELISANQPQPLFVAQDDGDVRQPITAPLTSAFNDNGLHMIFFGTGTFYRVGDNVVPDNPRIDTFYGIIDRGDEISGRDNLREQVILTEQTVQDTQVRGVSAYEMEAGHDGWFIDLVWDSRKGERVVSRATVRGDRVIFATVIPSQDPCAFGGESWLMELNTFTGGRLPYAVFDINADDAFDQEDWITVTDENGDDIQIPPSAMNPDIKIIKTPAIIAGVGENNDEVKIMSGSSGELIRVSERGGVGIGRQSWRQLR